MAWALRWRVGLVAAALAASSACSGEPEAAEPGVEGLPAGTVSCTTDPRVDTYTANMEKLGEQGALTFRLSQIEPAPPAKGSNTFHVWITDAAGAPVSGALGVDLKMPDHGHGTSVKPVISFDAETSSYTLQPLYLFMAGVWRIELDAYAGAAAAATPLDTAVLYFCIEG